MVFHWIVGRTKMQYSVENEIRDQLKLTTVPLRTERLAEPPSAEIEAEGHIPVHV